MIVAKTINVDLVGFTYKVEVDIADPTLKNVYTTKEEAYELNINTSGAELKVQTYVGLVRGL